MKNKKFCRGNKKMISGVCSGIGNYFNLDPNFIRFLFIILNTITFYIIIIYLILSLIMPKVENSNENKNLINKLYKDEHNKKIFGICSGLAIYLNVSINIIRLTFIILGVINPFLIIAYIILNFVIPIDDGIIDL